MYLNFVSLMKRGSTLKGKDLLVSVAFFHLFKWQGVLSGKQMYLNFVSLMKRGSTLKRKGFAPVVANPFRFG